MSKKRDGNLGGEQICDLPCPEDNNKGRMAHTQNCLFLSTKDLVVLFQVCCSSSEDAQQQSWHKALPWASPWESSGSLWRIYLTDTQGNIPVLQRLKLSNCWAAWMCYGHREQRCQSFIKIPGSQSWVCGTRLGRTQLLEFTGWETCFRENLSFTTGFDQKQTHRILKISAKSARWLLKQ